MESIAQLMQAVTLLFANADNCDSVGTESALVHYYISFIVDWYLLKLAVVIEIG